MRPQLAGTERRPARPSNGVRPSDLVLLGSIAVGATVGFSMTGSAAFGTAVGAVVGVLASRAIERRHAERGEGGS